MLTFSLYIVSSYPRFMKEKKMPWLNTSYLKSYSRNKLIEVLFDGYAVLFGIVHVPESLVKFKR